jgi:hypothetical protein
MHTEQTFEQKMSKLTPQNQSLGLQNNTDIHCYHSQHNCRLNKPTHFLRSAEDCQIPQTKRIVHIALSDNSPPITVYSNIHHLALTVKASVIFTKALMFAIFSFNIVISKVVS